jgi:hypothetical protein
VGGPHSVEQIEQLRRSAACTGGLHPSTLQEILTGYAELARRQREVERILAQLLPSWRNAKDCLNRLAKVVREPGGADGI